MKRLPTMSLILLTLLLIPLFQNLPTVRGDTEDVNYFFKSTVTYVNPSGNSEVWNFTEDDRTTGLFMNNTWQTVELVNSTFPMETKEDEDGNSIGVLQFPNSTLIPGKDVSFTVWYHVVSKPRRIPNISERESGNLADIPDDLESTYTREEGPWQTSNPTLQELAYNLTRNDRVLSIVKSFVGWIELIVKYPDQEDRHEIPFYPIETYNQKEGDCDDKAMLLVTLCRIVGIPSFLQIGSIYLSDAFDSASYWEGHVSMVERQIGWHGWAMVYIPPWGWLPVDLTYAPNLSGDPLNAINHGAVTIQNTTQYMNVTHTDYVASSLEDRAFLINNGFQVHMEDEMIKQGKQDGIQRLPAITDYPWVPLTLTMLVAFVIVISVFFSRRWRKRGEEPTPTPTDTPS